MVTDPPIAWYLNLDADRELQAPAAYRPAAPSALHARTAQMADLIAAQDRSLDDLTGELTDYVALAFCPTPRALARIAATGLEPPRAPPLAVLRRVNDRAFCAELGQTLPNACFARDLASLERQLQQPSPSGRYVIKRAFSFAGREQRRVHDATLDESTRGFCLRSFQRAEGVQIEPWLERLGDYSLHGYLASTGALSIGPVREQRCDPMGRFLGMSLAPARVSAAETGQLHSELTHTAAALQRAGYFGPFGIDAFRYRLPDGRLGFHARCEINARFTMGYPRALVRVAVMDSRAPAL